MAEEDSFVSLLVDEEEVVVVVEVKDGDDDDDDVGDEEDDKATHEGNDDDVNDRNGFGVWVVGNPVQSATTQQHQQQTKRFR